MFPCTGFGGTPCPTSHVAGSKSNLNTHRARCAQPRPRGGSRANTGRKPYLPSNTPVHLLLLRQPAFAEDSSALTARLLQRVDAYFADGNTNRQTCACCNELFAPPKMKSVDASGHWLRRLRNRLTWRHTTHPVNNETKQFYDVSATEPALINVPLAKAGVVANGNGSSKVKYLSCFRDYIVISADSRLFSNSRFCCVPDAG
jgi:hypothetical protein